MSEPITLSETSTQTEQYSVKVGTVVELDLSGKAPNHIVFGRSTSTSERRPWDAEQKPEVGFNITGENGERIETLSRRSLELKFQRGVVEITNLAPSPATLNTDVVKDFSLKPGIPYPLTANFANLRNLRIKIKPGIVLQAQRIGSIPGYPLESLAIKWA